MGTILITIILFALLVLVHEFGHFFAARRLGVAVEEFGFGFPPRLWGIKRGNTTYTINAIPLGGFVRLKGEDERESGPDSFRAQKAWKRSLIIISGVIMNALLAYVLIIPSLRLGRVVDVAAVQATGGVQPTGVIATPAELTILGILEKSPAAQAHLVPGDKILSIGAIDTPNIEQFTASVRSSTGPVEMVIEHALERKKVSIEPALIKPEKENKQVRAIGISMGMLSHWSYTFPSIFWYAAQEWAHMFVAIIQGFGHLLADLFGKFILPEDVAGPVGIVKIIGLASTQGIGTLLYFGALLSMNLAIVNILPIPALDGGRFFLTILETVRRKKIPIHIEARIHQVGFLLLLLLVLLITIKDVRGLLPA